MAKSSFRVCFGPHVSTLRVCCSCQISGGGVKEIFQIARVAACAAAAGAAATLCGLHSITKSSLSVSKVVEGATCVGGEMSSLYVCDGGYLVTSNSAARG